MYPLLLPNQFHQDIQQDCHEDITQQETDAQIHGVLLSVRSRMYVVVRMTQEVVQSVSQRMGRLAQRRTSCPTAVIVTREDGSSPSTAMERTIHTYQN